MGGASTTQKAIKPPRLCVGSDSFPQCRVWWGNLFFEGNSERREKRVWGLQLLLKTKQHLFMWEGRNTQKGQNGPLLTLVFQGWNLQREGSLKPIWLYRVFYYITHMRENFKYRKSPKTALREKFRRNRSKSDSQLFFKCPHSVACGIHVCWKLQSWWYNHCVLGII